MIALKKIPPPGQGISDTLRNFFFAVNWIFVLELEAPRSFYLNAFRIPPPSTVISPAPFKCY